MACKGGLGSTVNFCWFHLKNYIIAVDREAFVVYTTALCWEALKFSAFYNVLVIPSFV